MKKIAFGAVALLFSLISTAEEPMATMKYVTNQVNRIDGRIDAVPTSSEFDFSDDLFSQLSPTDGIDRVKTVLNAVIEKLKAVGKIEKGN